MLGVRLFLLFVGVIYLLLSLLCSFGIEQVSGSIGFSLTSSAAKSEFLSVYGGLEFALGLIFLWPMLQPRVTMTLLNACLIIHASLGLFRLTGFILFSVNETKPYYFLATEILISVISLILILKVKPNSVAQENQAT